MGNDQGNRTTPSYVAFTDTERLIGDAAKNQVAINPTNTVFDAKRLIGRKYADSSVQADMKHWPFKIVDSSSKPKIEVEYKSESKTFTPEEISAMILLKMKETAEGYLGHEVCLVACQEQEQERAQVVQEDQPSKKLIKQYLILKFTS